MERILICTTYIAMDKKTFACIVTPAAAGCAVAATAVSAATPRTEPRLAGERPNIIVILSDDMGYSDIGAYGGIIQTPNLDLLAQNGLRYTQFYNTARSCPTRASLLTGLNPHQTGIGHMTENRGEDGYRGDLNGHCVTFGEVLRPAGYGTYAVGKWHVTPFVNRDDSKYNWPLQRGFDHFYGTIPGGGSFYDPFGLTRDNTVVTVANDPEYRPEEFFYTDAIADNAVSFMRLHEQQSDDKPFFMYVAFTAAHWPMHVPEKWVAPYYGKFDEGWDELRNRKYRDMVDAGIIRKEWALSVDPSVEKWVDVENKEFEMRCMEVYAGMISNLDHNIGKIVEQLRQSGELDNTVIMYLQDNGGCAEPMERERKPFEVRVPAGEDLSPMAPDEFQTRLIPFKTRDGRPVRRGQVSAGGADTYVAYGKSWAYLSNTPFREFKHWVHEGGISTPLIVHWPAGIKNSGESRQRPGQLMDIMATCVELAGADYPETFGGNQIYPCEGESLVHSFRRDESGASRHLYWEHEGNRAIRIGKWKLVYKYGEGEKDIPHGAWELYDMEADRTETTDLARKYPARVSKLATQWEEWAVEHHVVPWPK
jgi:arylsulfatase